MASTTLKRAKGLPVVTLKTISGASYSAVENFAVFIDTHRDQPHVPSFEDDIHRGWAKPTIVHYVPPDSLAPLGYLVRASDQRTIHADVKHKFVDLSWWQEFVTDYLFENGESPVQDSGEFKGMMPTSKLRDARAKVYHLKSLRQIVNYHENKAWIASMKGGT